MKSLAGLAPEHFIWEMRGDVAVIRLNRPERKNPLTFESYAELRDTFRDLVYASDVHAVVFTANGENFCSGGDVHEIIGPLVGKDMKGLLEFTRMTGDLVKAMLNCGKPIIAAVDGICVGAGAIIAMASDIRFATPAPARRFCLPGWAWRAVTWAPAQCYRALSARAAPPTCSTAAAA